MMNIFYSVDSQLSHGGAERGNVPNFPKQGDPNITSTSGVDDGAWTSTSSGSGGSGRGLKQAFTGDGGGGTSLCTFQGEADRSILCPGCLERHEEYPPQEIMAPVVPRYVTRLFSWKSM